MFHNQQFNKVLKSLIGIFTDFSDNLARLEFLQVISDYVIAKNKKKGNKGERARRTRGETAKYCFSILLAGDDGETRCQQCFQKKYTTPAATPARGMSICIFSTPFSFPVIIVISCSYGKHRACKFRNKNIGRK